ncbi:MAG: ATP-binding protein [Proteobacteria bacterium]|nr:ATP-binding protein [Pseudomonadota bacterium]
MPDSVIAPLRVANEAFLVSSMIERCPKTMMLRELVVNGLEAAEHAPAGDRRVVIGSRLLEGASKLRIWNTGPGLTAAELLQITDLASSLRKQNSLEANFGMGAKVASLPSNRHGLRYRSCAGGRVSEVMLGYRDGVYGRLRAGSGNAEVVDATEACRTEGGYDCGFDWTEVLLCGNAAEQDTVLAPYGGSPAVPPHWLADYVENRFFRLPAHVTLTLMPEVCGGASPRAVAVLGGQDPGNGRRETRVTASGVKVHYAFDPPDDGRPRLVADPAASGASRGSIVFRNEMYDVRGSDGWLHDAPMYGVSFGARYVSVFVELPDDYLVLPEAYRQFLRFRGNDQKQVYLADFAALVRACMPPWLAEIIRGFGPSQGRYVDEISGELRALLAELGVLPQSQTAGAPGQSLAARAARHATMAARPAEAPAPAAPKPLAPPPKPQAPRFERPPEIIGLRDREMIRERALDGRAAKFYPQSHQIFVNLSYPAVRDMAAALEGAHEPGGPHDEETVRRIATETAEWCLTKQVTRALVYSLAKKDLGWRPEEVARGQSPESLSLVADDWAGLMETARLRFQAKLATNHPAGEAPVHEPPMLRTVAA